MGDHNQFTDRPDAFKALMEEARIKGRPELANQCQGRALTDIEDKFADALMAAYADGATGEDAIADALVKNGVLRPSTNKPDWTAATLSEELQTLNSDFDTAYQTNGYGA